LSARPTRVSCRCVCAPGHRVSAISASPTRFVAVASSPMCRPSSAALTLSWERLIDDEICRKFIESKRLVVIYRSEKSGRIRCISPVTRRGFFEPAEAEIAVLDVQPADRHLLLLVRLPSQRALT